MVVELPGGMAGAMAIEVSSCLFLPVYLPASSCLFLPPYVVVYGLGAWGIPPIGRFRRGIDILGF